MIPAHPRSAARFGFTRVDLLAGLAAFVILSPLVFGALSSGELNVRQTECLTKIRLLTLAVSLGFVDGHAEVSPLEKLWTFSWHRDCKPSASPPE